MLVARLHQGRGARRGACALPLRSWQRKLPGLRNGLHPEASNPVFRAKPFRRRTFSASSCSEEAVALTPKIRDFLRVARAYRPEKSLRSTHGTFERCRLQGGQMAKVERGETVWKLRIGSVLWSREPAERGEGPLFSCFALARNTRSNPSSDFPDNLGRRILRSSGKFSEIRKKDYKKSASRLPGIPMAMCPACRPAAMTAALVFAVRRC